MSLCSSSWLLRHHIYPGSWRQTPGQPAADKNWWGGNLSVKPQSQVQDLLFFFNQVYPHSRSSREALPHRLWLHPGSRPQAAAAAHEAEQRDGGGHGGDAERAVPGVQEAVLHRLPPPQEVLRLIPNSECRQKLDISFNRRAYCCVWGIIIC